MITKDYLQEYERVLKDIGNIIISSYTKVFHLYFDIKGTYFLLPMSFKVAPYSFLKSGKHIIQIQNLVHWYIVRRMKLNAGIEHNFENQNL